MRYQRTNERNGEAKYKECTRETQSRVVKTMINKRAGKRYIPYVAHKEDERRDTPHSQSLLTVPTFTIPLRCPLEEPNVSSRQEYPRKTDRVLGYNWSA